jgi:hypothetical protein
MQSPSPASVAKARRAIVVSVCAFLTLILAALLTYYQLQKTEMLVNERVRLDKYLDGSAAKPFIYRVLIPNTVRAAEWLVPEPVAAAVEASPFTKYVLPKDGVTGVRPIYFYLFGGILFAILIGYAAVSTLLYRSLYGPTEFSNWVGPICLAMIVPFLTFGFAHQYDFAVLLLMTSLLLAMSKERHVTFIVLLAIATLNKETAFLAIVAYGCYFFDRMPIRRLAMFVGAQFAVYVTIQVGLHTAFAANPGQSMEVWWGSNIAWLMTRTFPQVAAFLLFALLIAYRWNDKPLLLRRSAWQLVPHLGLIFFGAYPGELRVLYDSLPILMMLGIGSFEWLVRGDSLLPQPSPRPS